MGVVIPVLPKLVETFEGGDTARAAAVYGVFGTAWALMQFVFDAHPGRPLGPVRAPPGDPRLLPRAGPGLLPHGARPEPRLALRRAGHLGHHGGERVDRVRLHRGRDARRRSAPPPSGWSARASGWASPWARRWAACWAASTRGCPSGWRAASRWPTPATAASCCRNRCRRKGAPRSRGSAPTPWGRCGCCARTAELFGHRRRALPHAARARGLPGGHGALHGLPVRLGRDGRGVRARRRGRVLDDRAGRASSGRWSSASASGARSSRASRSARRA